jgi:hypothetical protein
MFDLSGRKKAIEELIATDQHRYIPEIPCQISSEVRGHTTTIV